jgi:hypothetical protein
VPAAATAHPRAPVLRDPAGRERLDHVGEGAPRGEGGRFSEKPPTAPRRSCVAARPHPALDLPMTRLWTNVALGALLSSAVAARATAQEPTPAPLAPAAQQPGPDLSDILHRHRARRARRAAADTSVLVQLETGYDGNFDSSTLTRDQSSALSVVVTPTSHLTFQADADVWASQSAPHQRTVHGRGDIHLTGQSTLRTARPGQLALGLAYDLKVPTARPRSLGSGRVDQRLLALLSLSSRHLEIDFSLGLDANGQPGGLDWGGEGAIEATVPLAARVAAHLGWSGETVDTDQPAGHYVSGGVTWQSTPVLALDVGGRLGVSATAPACGLTAGVTAAIWRP